jgi:hypothetical protein
MHAIIQHEGDSLRRLAAREGDLMTISGTLLRQPPKIITGLPNQQGLLKYAH